MNLLNNIPIKQKFLFNYDNIFLDIANLYNKKILPNKIILSGAKGIGKSTFAYHLTNYIFSKNEDYSYNINNFEINELNKSYKLINNNSHPNFHLIDLIDEKKNIEIQQIRKMIDYANKSSFNNKEKIVLIDNAEYLNLNSLNALLKIIEEPNENLFFILILDNNKSLIKTLKSRCIKFNFFLAFDQSINIANKILNDDLSTFINNELINHYNTPGDIINLLKYTMSNDIDLSKISLKDFLITLIDGKHYKNNTFIKKNIYKYIEYYFLDLINYNINKNYIVSKYYYFINKINDFKKFNLDEESLFIEIKSKVLNG